MREKFIEKNDEDSNILPSIFLDRKQDPIKKFKNNSLNNLRAFDGMENFLERKDKLDEKTKDFLRYLTDLREQNKNFKLIKEQKEEKKKKILFKRDEKHNLIQKHDIDSKSLNKKRITRKSVEKLNSSTKNIIFEKNNSFLSSSKNSFSKGSYKSSKKSYDLKSIKKKETFKSDRSNSN